MRRACRRAGDRQRGAGGGEDAVQAGRRGGRDHLPQLGAEAAQRGHVRLARRGPARAATAARPPTRPGGPTTTSNLAPSRLATKRASSSGARSPESGSKAHTTVLSMLGETLRRPGVSAAHPARGTRPHPFGRDDRRSVDAAQLRDPRPRSCRRAPRRRARPRRRGRAGRDGAARARSRVRTACTTSSASCRSSVSSSSRCASFRPTRPDRRDGRNPVHAPRTGTSRPAVDRPCPGRLI